MYWLKFHLPNRPGGKPGPDSPGLAPALGGVSLQYKGATGITERAGKRQKGGIEGFHVRRTGFGTRRRLKRKTGVIGEPHLYSGPSEGVECAESDRRIPGVKAHDGPVGEAGATHLDPRPRLTDILDTYRSADRDPHSAARFRIGVVHTGVV